MKDKSHLAVFKGIPTNEQESNSYANLLATGNYPVGLDGCFTVGDSGGCGFDCYVFQEGNCEVADEVLEQNYKNLTEEEIKIILEIYPQHKQLYNNLIKKEEIK